MHARPLGPKLMKKFFSNLLSMSMLSAKRVSEYTYGSLRSELSTNMYQHLDSYLRPSQNMSSMETVFDVEVFSTALILKWEMGWQHSNLGRQVDDRLWVRHNSETRATEPEVLSFASCLSLPRFQIYAHAL